MSTPLVGKAVVDFFNRRVNCMPATVRNMVGVARFRIYERMVMSAAAEHRMNGESYKRQDFGGCDKHKRDPDLVATDNHLYRLRPVRAILIE